MTPLLRKNVETFHETSLQGFTADAYLNLMSIVLTPLSNSSCMVQANTNYL